MILPPPTWLKSPSQPSLLSGEIHIWRASLTDGTHAANCLAVLSADELIRAERFAFSADRQHFIISHGALRHVLARYLSADPRALKFRTGAHGKPALVQRFTDIRFNLSHSAGLALIAVTRGREVGVDLEQVNGDILFEDIAEHYFEPEEAWALRTAPTDERVSRFFDVWTRMEAALKASGAGLSGEATGARAFAVRSFVPAMGFAGAVASEGDDWRLACWEWSL